MATKEIEASPAANPLGTEKIGRLLRKFAIPGIISMVVNSLYNMVDQIFIGQGVGMLGNGATNIIAPIATVSIALASLLGDGLATYFSLHLGQGDTKEASRAVGTSIITGIVTGSALMALVMIFLTPLCNLFGATENILPYALDYGFIIAAGFPFVVVGVVINGVVRADGSPTYSMISMMAGTILNFILDPLLIFKFNMGVKGAAIATIISQAISMIMNIGYLFRFKNIKMTRQSFKFSIKLSLKLMGLGISSFINTLTSTVVGMVSNNLFTHYGALSVYGADIPITVFGLCMKVSMLFFSIAMGITSGGRPIEGFNYGAGKNDRVKRTFKLVLISTTAVMTVAWLIYMIFPLQLIRIFGSESAAYEEFAVKCFRTYLMTAFLGGVQPSIGSLFQSMGKPGLATIISLGKQLIFYVPPLFILSHFFGLEGLLWAGPVAEILAFVLSAILAKIESKKLLS